MGYKNNLFLDDSLICISGGKKWVLIVASVGQNNLLLILCFMSLSKNVQQASDMEKNSVSEDTKARYPLSPQSLPGNW